MTSPLAGIDFTDTLLLKQVMLWMDGGSVTLSLIDKNSTEFEVDFCQTMSLNKHPYTSIPGSFLFNKVEIPIRSDDERIALNALKHLKFSNELLVAERHKPESLATYREIIDERIAFVESNEYLTIARKMGRL